jgi:Asp-tRNA(Asn)/Glu-tRNA(Gln) amidotransferase A subunit family amidase
VSGTAPVDPTALDATALAVAVRTRELSPVEILAAYRARGEQLNGPLNAIVTRDERAEALAREAEAAVLRGDQLGPLHGVPFTIKDSLDTAGVRTTRGSLLFAEHVPHRDATAVARMRAAGAIPLGKTNMPEFALWWESGNRVFGATSNPWDLSRTAGGSTGGEAAALAVGMTAVGLGSDVGGSIRIPASHCGVVGFKPTHGRVPITGHWPDSLQRFMHVGPLARSVRDVALALTVLAGPDGVDWHAVPVPVPAVPDVPGELGRLRVACSARGLGPVAPEVAAVVEAAGAALAGAGAQVESTPWEPPDCNRLTLTVYGCEASGFFADLTAGREDDLHPLLRARLGRPLPPLPDYVEAEAEVERIRASLTAFLRDHDVLLCPSASVPAHRHDMTELVVDGRAHHPRDVMRATIPFDLTGSPALTVPFGSSPDGLPIGVQVVGRRFEEETVLRVGLALEALRGPLRRPPLALAA